jgi:maltose alpha-D-glucosyltransferase/alpha-amylase
MLAIRKTSHAFGRGKLSFLRPGNRKVLAYLRELNDEAILCVGNLSRAAQPVELDLKKFKGRIPVELLGRTSFPPIGDLPYLLTCRRTASTGSASRATPSRRNGTPTSWCPTRCR